MDSAKSPPEGHAAVSATIVAAVMASATEPEEGSTPPWRPDDEYAYQVLVDTIIRSGSALPGNGNGGQRFTNLQSIIYTKIGREYFDMTAFWRIVDYPDAFTTEFWKLFSQSIRPASTRWMKTVGRLGSTGKTILATTGRRTSTARCGSLRSLRSERSSTWG